MIGYGRSMGNRLFYFWRLLATGWCFLSFSFGGLILAVLVFPVLNLANIFIPESREKYQRAQTVIHYAFKFFIRQMMALGIMRVQVNGIERLQSEGPKLILANHPTIIDVVLLISFLKHTNCVVKKALWRDPFLGGVVRAAGYISNDGSEALVEDCVAALQKGDNLLIFPEGTRSVPGQPLRLQRGAGHIAARGGVEVLPVTITCNPPTLTKAEKWYHIPPRKFELRAEVGDPINMQNLAATEDPPSVVSRRITSYLLDYFTERLKCFERAGAGT